MAKRHRNPQGNEQRPVGRSATQLRVRKVAGEDAWEFVNPRCAADRAEDLEEVRKMIDAGETEIATDELRWLLNGCSDFLEAHKTLGELALLESDIPLARGHFGYAFQIGKKALDAAGCRGLVPYRLASNTAFHEAGKGLAFSLRELGKRELLTPVLETLLRCDPSDPLGVQGFAKE